MEPNHPHPRIDLPEPFFNAAGSIDNLVLGDFKSAALITSYSGSVRANHYHKTDWHYTYVLRGAVDYFWRPVGSREKVLHDHFRESEMFFTPPMVEHAMFFSTNSEILTFSRNLRDHDSHESDVVRLVPPLVKVAPQSEPAHFRDVAPGGVILFPPDSDIWRMFHTQTEGT